MSKIVYLIGAGASCQSLPMVSQIKDRIPNLIGLIKKDSFGLNDQHTIIPGKSNLEIIDKFIEDLEWMNQLNSNHYSIDTFAKKLFLTKDKINYCRLKLILSNYFLIEQKLNKPDIRYDFFFASIFSNEVDLPKDIKILSWNYDNQFELSLGEYIHDRSLNSARQSLRVQEKFYNGIHEEPDPFLYRINGSFGYFTDDESYKNFLDLYSLSQREFLRKILIHHNSNLNSDNYKSGLSYSWEKPKITFDYIDNIMKDCEVLVSIGYSFPFFNREVDKKIFSSSNLDKIYIQDPCADEIIEKIKGMHVFSRNTSFVPNKSLTEFLIPFEF